MPLGIGVCVGIVFVTFVYVGPLSRPAIVAETRLRRNILSPIVTIAVFSCVLERGRWRSRSGSPLHSAHTKSSD